MHANNSFFCNSYVFFFAHSTHTFIRFMGPGRHLASRAGSGGWILQPPSFPIPLRMGFGRRLSLGVARGGTWPLYHLDPFCLNRFPNKKFLLPFPAAPGPQGGG